MGMEFFLFRGTLNNVTTSFDDAAFTGLALKSSRINFTTKGGVSCCLSPVKDITNSSILNSQMIATNYFYQLFLQVFTYAINFIFPGFWGGDFKGMSNILVGA